jgi:hypothetical protein
LAVRLAGLPVSAAYTVMSGLGPDIHVFLCYDLKRRGCRAFAQHDGVSRTQWAWYNYVVGAITGQ